MQKNILVGLLLLLVLGLFVVLWMTLPSSLNEKELPLEVQEAMTSDYPHATSPASKWIAYVRPSEEGLSLFIYGKDEMFYLLEEFPGSSRGLSAFAWEGDEQLSVVEVHLLEDESYEAHRLTYEFLNSTWQKTNEELVEGEVECNPIYCDVL